jgi:hypothetical protein
MAVVELRRELGLEGGAWKSVRALVFPIIHLIFLKVVMFFWWILPHKMMDKRQCFEL